MELGSNEAVRFAEVSPKAIKGAQRHLAQHERQLDSRQEEEAYHQRMIKHYQLLLEHREAR